MGTGVLAARDSTLSSRATSVIDPKKLAWDDRTGKRTYKYILYIGS